MRYYGIPLLVGAGLALVMLWLSAFALEDEWAISYHDGGMIYLMISLPCGWAALTRFVRKLKGGKGYMNPVLKIILLPLILMYWYLKMMPSMVIGFIAGPYYFVRFVLAVSAAARMPHRPSPQVEMTQGYDDQNGCYEACYEDIGERSIGFSTPHNAHEKT